MARYLAIATLGLALVACGGEGDLVVASQATNKAGAAGAAGAGDGLAGKGGSAQGGKAGAAGQPGAAGKGGSAGAGGQGGSAGVGGSGGSAGQSGAAGAGGDPIQPFRTIEQRNPFGNYAESKNLLWDGDFEWAGPFIQQYSWSSTKSWTTAGPPEIIASPDCRSGLKCARLSKGNAATGIGVSPSTAQARLQVWARVEPGNTCSKVTVYLAACFTSESAKSPLKPTSDTPDAKGWCHYDEQRPTPTSTPCVLISNKSKGVVLVDDVSLGFGSDSAPPSTSKPELPDPDDNALFELLRSDLRKRRKGDEAPQRPSMPTSIPRVRQAPRGR